MVFKLMLQNATKPTSGLYQVKIIFFKYKKVFKCYILIMLQIKKYIFSLNATI